MDCLKTGRLIFKLRKEKGLTQKQLADDMNISDKTISKWERGLGCPDISLVNALSEIFCVSAENLLDGCLNQNSKDGGNMKKIKFYMCSLCGNIITSPGNPEISCCGRKLQALTAKPCDKEHYLNIETAEDEYYITFSHEMSKSHYLNFIAYADLDRVLFVRLYPEQGGELRIPKMHGGKFYFGCNKHGLWIVE